MTFTINRHIHTKSEESPDPGVPIQRFICINLAMRLLAQTVSLRCLWSTILDFSIILFFSKIEGRF